MKMKISSILKTRGEWLSPNGGHHPIVISSRVRLARNLAKLPFPGWAKKTERIRILDEIKPEVENLALMRNAFSEQLNELSALEKQVLVERHLISREHAAKGMGSAVAINSTQTVSIMMNEEDHLRMQAVMSGLDLQKTFHVIDDVDTALEAHLDFAFDPALGYLTACPTNVGTGMRASAMVHLPGLVLSEQINQVINSINKIGLAVRGLYGEGTEAMGNLFQVSNQTTLGENESQIIERLNKVIRR
jgi:protein arginine kinase